MADDGEVTLKIGAATLGGWTSVQIARGIELMPSNFSVSLTERYPGEASALVVQPGDPVVVSIGSDPVITGFVDRFIPTIEKQDHTIRVIGRSKSCDLVDCAAEWPGGQITGSSCLQIAQKLAKPYGITVAANVDTGANIPQFNLTIGETAYAIIERIARYRGLLFFDKTDGTTVFDQAGNGSMASGVKEGANVQAASAEFSMDERFSEYLVFLQSTQTLEDTGDAGNLPYTAKDPGVTRHRRMTLIAEAGGGGIDVAQKRADWEAARRAGRSNVISVLVDSWRDSAGTLWTPNFSLPVDLPSLKVPAFDWIIGAVNFLLDPEGGTTAELTIMPRDAFKPEPILLQPFPADVTPVAAP